MRLRILSDSEIDALYGRPRFTQEERVEYFSLAPAEKSALEQLRFTVVLVTGDADFVHLALQLRRRGIRVEVAATAQTLGTGLKGAANEVIDLVPLFETFELMKPGD